MSGRYEYTLPELRSMFTDTIQQVEKLRDRPVVLLSFKPAPDIWSPVEICRHLIIFGNRYLEQMDKAVAEYARMPRGTGPFRPRWHFRRMAALFEPPYKLKMKTMPMFDPEPTDDERTGEILDELADLQIKVLNIIERAESEGWNLQKIRGKNPAYRFLSMNLAEFLVLMAVHQRRHFWQIEQLFRLAQADGTHEGVRT